MQQYKLSINTTARGYTIITHEIEKVIDIAAIKVGLLHIFLQHSSASLSINENADPTVRADFKAFEEKLVPRNFPYQHNYEGDDDMPAHITQIPIVNRNKECKHLMCIRNYQKLNPPDW